MEALNRSALWVILASATLTVMAGSIIAPVLNLMREGLGTDQASVGLIITTHGLFIALFSPLFGILIDRIGVKKPLILGLILYGLAGGSGLFITSYWVLILSRALLGMGVAAIFASITVIILNLYKGAARNKVMGWRDSANSFGGIVWPLIGGGIGRFSWHLPFAVYLIGIPLGFLVLATVPETHREKKQDAGGSVLKVFRNNPTLFAIYGLRFLGSILLYSIVVFLPQLLEKFSISNPFYISLFLSTMALSAGLTSFLYGRIKSRLSHKMIVVITLFLWAVGFTIISQVSSSLIIAFAVALFGIGQGMITPTVTVWIGEIAPAPFFGRISSYIGTFGLMGQFLSPIIFAPVALFLGLNNVFLVAGAASAIIFVLFLAAKIK